MTKLSARLMASAAAMVAFGATSFAQPPGPRPTRQPGLLHRMFHRNSHPYGGGLRHPMSGGVIGNKRTHVYHLPGDPGALPDAANRVYFKSEMAARGAGYHHAGRSSSKRLRSGGMTGARRSSRMTH